MKKLLLPLLLLAILATGCKPQNEPENPTPTPTPTPTPEIKPVEASFTVTIKQPLSIVVTNTSKNATSGIFSFGDGTNDSRATLTHRYAGKGVYKVTLTARNEKYSQTVSQNITIENPTKCYITGCQFDKVPYNNKYYYAKLNDDDLITGTWFTTQWQLLSSANLPFTYMFTKSTEMTGLSGDNYYTLYVYHSDTKSGSGTQCMAQKITTATEIYGAYPTKITKYSNNNETQMTIFFEWK